MQAAAEPSIALDSDTTRRIRAGRQQLLARAVGLHKRRGLHVCDATAGLGRDAIVLAALGAHVDLFERNAQACAFLRRRLAALSEAWRPRLCLIEGDALSHLETGRWDVVYLDPMFAERGKRALPRAEAQQLRAWAAEDPCDADALLAPARRVARLRVVVKRSLKAPYLAGLPPHQSLRGNRVRFDLYLPSAIPE